MNAKQKIYNIIVSDYLQNTLQNRDWKIHNTEGGMFIAHKDFLNIQNELDQLDQKHTGWSEIECTAAVSKYLSAYICYRKRHNTILKAALSRCTPHEQNILNAWFHSLDRKITLSSDNNMLIGIPWYSDNIKLWKDYLRITENEIATFASWSKINEVGLLFASRIHRHDNPEGHDYFSYASRNRQDPRKKFLLTAQHEGSHGLLDALATELLGLPACNPISEGIAGYLGNDGREKDKTQLDLISFLHFAWLDNRALEKEGTYIASSKFFKALECIKTLESTQSEANVIIFYAVLQTLIYLPKDITNFESNRKYNLFYTELLSRLHLAQDDLLPVFNHVDTHVL